MVGSSSSFDPGPREPWARRILTVLFLGVAGLFLFRFGLPGVILGGDYVAGGAAVTAQLDSETRFMSAILLGVGVGIVWLARNFESYPRAAVLLSVFALLGGLLRLVSMALYGTPGFIAVVATGIELLVPLTTLALLSRRAKTLARG